MKLDGKCLSAIESVRQRFSTGLTSFEESSDQFLGWGTDALEMAGGGGNRHLHYSFDLGRYL